MMYDVCNWSQRVRDRAPKNGQNLAPREATAGPARDRETREERNARRGARGMRGL